MRHSKPWVLLLALVMAARTVFAQGALLVPPDEYAAMVRRAATTTRAVCSIAAPCSNGPMPRSVDLSANLPPAGSQGQVPSCTAWAVANAVSYFVSLARGGRTKEGRAEMHAPMHLYRRIHGEGTCDRGTRIDTALDVVAREGIPPWDPATGAQDRCDATISAAAREKAGLRRILPPQPLDNTDVEHGIDARAHLAAGHPVIVSFETTRAFQNLWGAPSYDIEAAPVICESTIAPLVNGRRNCAHAMVVVGYDEQRGAYRVLNSWGRDWGERGYIWITWRAWRAHAKQAFAVTGLESPLGVQCAGGSEWSIDRQHCECTPDLPVWDRFEERCIRPPQTCPDHTTWSNRAHACMCDNTRWWVEARRACEPVACLTNTSWNPETHRCICRELTEWDQARRRCVVTHCPEGEMPTADHSECVCPFGQQRAASGRCEPLVCAAPRVLNPWSNTCACLDGALWDEARNVCRPATMLPPTSRVTLRVQCGGPVLSAPVSGAAQGGRLVNLPGFYRPVPTAVIEVPEGVWLLSVHIEAAADTTLLLEAPDGSNRANDDANVGPHPQDPQILVHAPAAGAWRVWVGTFEASPEYTGTMRVQALANP